MALASDAQVDVDLSDYAFELAHLLGRATGALVAKDRELTAEFRSVAVALGTTAGSDAASSELVLSGVLGPTPQSWSGSYPTTGKELTLTIDAGQSTAGSEARSTTSVPAW